jgi:hypothetical protein
MLKRFASNFAPVMNREFIAKRDFEIIQRDSVSSSVKNRHERSRDLRQTEAALSGQSRDQLCCDQKPKPFKPVAKSFPSRTHFPF